MTTRLQAKQIDKLFKAPVFVSGYSFPAAATSIVTAALTAAFLTAADDGTAIPLQVENTVVGNPSGVVVAVGRNRSDVWVDGTEAKLISASGAEVFGEVTEAAGAYTLSLFSIEAGVKTAFTPSAATTVSFSVPYLFTFEQIPRDALSGGASKFVSQDPAGGDRTLIERLTVTGVNVLSALSTAVKAGTVSKLSVNGQVLSSLGGASAPFSVAGTAVTWSATNAGYSLVPGVDVVDVEYKY